MNVQQQTNDEAHQIARLALYWALENTCMLIPPGSQTPLHWVWDEEDLSLVRETGQETLRFHVARVNQRRLGVLVWSDNDGQTTWEGFIPAEVFE